MYVSNINKWNKLTLLNYRLYNSEQGKCSFFFQVVEEGVPRNVKLKIDLLKEEYTNNIADEQKTGKSIPDTGAEVNKR